MDSIMIKTMLTLLTSTTLMQAQLSPYDIRPDDLKSDRYMKIKILDAKELSFKFGSNISELSALAYSKNRLYALSDNGELYHFDLKFKNDKIKSLVLTDRFMLKNKKNKPLKKQKRDSEGLALVDDTLLISFEKKSRVELYTLEGVKIEKKKIHKSLRDLKSYARGNKGLEAVTYSKKYGIITAPEIPLKGEKKSLHTLYAKQKTWKFKASGSLTDMTFIDKNNLLVLERKFDKHILRWLITISRVSLQNCDSSRVCKQEVLASLDNTYDWKIDNFEGLTKISKNKFLMVSDDNDMFFQNTLLVYFEILD